MDLLSIIELIKTIGLPLVILLGVVYYFYQREKKHEQDLKEKDEVILNLNKEKLDILEKALDKFQESDSKSINALNQINTTLQDLKDQIQELKYRINGNN